MPHRGVAAPHAQLQILDLLPVRGRLQRRLKVAPVRAFHPIHQPMTNQFVFAIARFVTTPVRIADKPCCIEHENHALGRVQNFLIKIALPLQLRLEHFLFRDVEHQPAHLRDSAARIAHAGNILQRIQQRSVSAAQRFFVIAQHAFRIQLVQNVFSRFRRGVEISADIVPQ